MSTHTKTKQAPVITAADPMPGTLQAIIYEFVVGNELRKKLATMRGQSDRFDRVLSNFVGSKMTLFSDETQGLGFIENAMTMMSADYKMAIMPIKGAHTYTCFVSQKDEAIIALTHDTPLKAALDALVALVMHSRLPAPIPIEGVVSPARQAAS